MNITIENAGAIRSASIKLNGLTVIAGENDTGKSTVGKLIFSIIKGTAQNDASLFKEKDEKIFGKIEELYYKLSASKVKQNWEILKEEFLPRHFHEEILRFFEPYQPYYLLEGTDLSDFEQYFEQKSGIIARNIEDAHLYKLLALLESIKIEILHEEPRHEKVKRALERVLYSEFYGELCLQDSSTLPKIDCSEGGNRQIGFSLKDNRIIDYRFDDDLYFKDATIIETPILLQMREILRESGTLYGKEGGRQPAQPKVQLHIKDLISKIEEAKYYQLRLFDECIPLMQEISELINGSFAFDSERYDFIFAKQSDGQDIRVRPHNTASGIKAFGLLQLMIQAGMVNKRSLLIFDEPENHLHPKWQVAFAKIIVSMAHMEIPILISSHSPYMIQAIKYYSQQQGASDLTSFYLAETGEDGGRSTIADVTQDLNRIFVKLSEPLHQLIWK